MRRPTSRTTGAVRTGPGRRRRVAPTATLAPLAALVLAASACSAGPDGSEDSAEPSSSASTTTQPSSPPTAEPVREPKDDGCHDLSYSQAVAPTVDPGTVPCARRHTTETYAVGTVDNVVDGHLLAVDSQQVQDQVASTCPERLAGALGGSQEDVRLSLLRSVWFTPSLDEAAQGADWYRCDVVALAGADELETVQGSLKGVLGTTEGREEYGMCGTANPDDKDFERVPCSEQHSWKAVATVDLPTGDYPGSDAVADRGQECNDLAAEEAADPLDYDWAFEGPDEKQWKDGQTFIRCWTPG